MLRYLTLWAISAFAVVSGASNNTLLHANLGPYPVSINVYQLNTSRPDVLAPTPQKRRLALNVFQPIVDHGCCEEEAIPYFPSPAATLEVIAFNEQLNLSLPIDTIEKLRLSSCNNGRAIPISNNEAPLLLFSTGLGVSRLAYSAICQAVASSGYTVISMDYPYEANIVEFPDGSLAFSVQNSTDVNDILNYVAIDQDIRVADAISVLDAVEQGHIPGLGNFPKPLKAGMFGHSLGGSTAAAMAENTSRIIAGVNYDGSFDTYVPNRTLDKPFFIFSEQMPENTTWSVMWDHLENWKAELSINNTLHLSFTDLPLIADSLGLRSTQPGLEKIIGTIEGHRMLEIMWRYTVSFFDFTMKGREPKLLEKPSPAFPEVNFIRTSENVANKG